MSSKTRHELGIIVSTPGEADLLLRELDTSEMSTLQRTPFFSGVLKGKIHAVICICGVGKTNAAHGTTLLIERFAPGHLYSVGVAGAYPGSGLDIGDVAVAENEFYGDEGLRTESGFHIIDALRLPPAFPLLIPETFADIPFKGNFVTVSACTGTLAGALELSHRFSALCENMEGAAVAHICALGNVPMTELRAISNIIGDREAKPLEAAGIHAASERVQKTLLKRI